MTTAARAVASRFTLAGALAHYVKTRDLKLNTIKDYKKVINRCFPDWLDMPINEVTRNMVVNRHQELSVSGKKDLVAPK